MNEVKAPFQNIINSIFNNAIPASDILKRDVDVFNQPPIRGLATDAIVAELRRRGVSFDVACKIMDNTCASCIDIADYLQDTINDDCHDHDDSDDHKNLYDAFRTIREYYDMYAKR